MIYHIYDEGWRVLLCWSPGGSVAFTTVGRAKRYARDVEGKTLKWERVSQTHWRSV